MPAWGGFTLLELMIVVIIIAILAAIALPQYLKTAERSRAAEALQILASIRAAEHRYRVENGAYTAGLANLDIDVPGFNGNPASPNWTFTTGAAAGANAVATRSAGAFQNATVEMDLDSGAGCNSNTVYGLAQTPC